MSRPTQGANESPEDFLLRSLAYEDGLEGRLYGWSFDNAVTLAESSVIQAAIATSSKDAGSETQRRRAYDLGVADRSRSHGSKPHRVLEFAESSPSRAVVVVGLAFVFVGAVGIGVWHALRR